MYNLLTSSQMRDADSFTISNKPIASLDLMEVASAAFVKEFKKEVPDKTCIISIFCGTGNNGGDGLAIARLLRQDGYENIAVWIVRFSGKNTRDFNSNLERLKKTELPIHELGPEDNFPEQRPHVIIDALLGSGLNKPVTGLLKQAIEKINALDARIIAIDVPSGFLSEGIIDTIGIKIKANLTLTFQRPKINFFFPESARSLAEFRVLSIGLDEEYIQRQDSPWKLITEQEVRLILKPRLPFSHKGTYGHALIIAGSAETMGAALLCADACLHSGAGLTTACIPETGTLALNTRSPEIMALIRERMSSDTDFSNYSAIAIGPGSGTDDSMTALFTALLDQQKIRLVIDADALNILALHPEFFGRLHELSILTPHMKEFDRLFGEHTSWWSRVETARRKAKEFNIIILLKNQYTFIVLPDGNVLINSTGNPAMSVGGMGDVLTGMIASFLAQGYTGKEAAILACYVHGKAGDVLRKEGMGIIPPRYLIEKLPFIISGLLEIE